ncbi:hypothetical protein ACH5RR_007220 [Cinchona calisaya]|uniref:Uncharacterized protein n=1 Tax=Cinchona calisaya TaxID=153742 RepID=A0ABD3AR56_9GENT
MFVKKVATRTFSNVGQQVKSPPKVLDTNDFHEADGDEDDWDDELEEEERNEEVIQFEIDLRILLLPWHSKSPRK